MKYSYILLERAQVEYETSLQWYKERSIKAAENFIQSIDATLFLICTYPERWRKSYKNFHELSLKKYPFSIVYIFDEKKQLIIVTSIYHHKRNPKKKYKRI